MIFGRHATSWCIWYTRVAFYHIVIVFRTIIDSYWKNLGTPWTCMWSIRFYNTPCSSLELTLVSQCSTIIECLFHVL